MRMRITKDSGFQKPREIKKLMPRVKNLAKVKKTGFPKVMATLIQIMMATKMPKPKDFEITKGYEIH